MNLKDAIKAAAVRAAHRAEANAVTLADLVKVLWPDGPDGTYDWGADQLDAISQLLIGAQLRGTPQPTMRPAHNQDPRRYQSNRKTSR